MKKFLCLILLMVMSVGVLTSCCMHQWSEATCLKPSTCSKCGETRGTYGEHSYDMYGKCTVCNRVSYETIDKFKTLVSGCYYLHWHASFDKDVEYDDEISITFSDTTITGSTCTAKGSIVVKGKNSKYYTDDFSVPLAYKDGKWVLGDTSKVSYGHQPSECNADGTIITYHYTESPIYVYRADRGKEKSVMKFDAQKCVIEMYNYYGYLQDSYEFPEYTIQHGIQWNKVILKGTKGEMEFVGYETSLIYDNNGTLYYYLLE